MHNCLFVAAVLALAAPVARAGTSGVVPRAAGGRLGVTHDSPGCGSEIAGQTPPVVRTLPAGPGLRGIALAPDGLSLYVTEFHTAKLHRLDLAEGRVTHTWAG